MAKLTDIKALIEASFQGDSGRANSLVKIARENGWFTTGGRGRNAPNMTPQDFANGLLLCLFTGSPTRCHEFLSAANNLTLRVCMIDNESFELNLSYLLDNPDEKKKFRSNKHWPPHIGKLPAVTLGGFLCQIFANLMENASPFRWRKRDVIAVSLESGNALNEIGVLNCEISLFESDWKESKSHLWHFRYVAMKLSEDEYLNFSEKRKIYHDTLQAFTDLAQGDLIKEGS